MTNSQRHFMTSFSNVVKNVDTSEYNADNIFHENIGHHPTLKFILKYRKKPQAMTISQFFSQMNSSVQ